MAKYAKGRVYRIVKVMFLIVKNTDAAQQFNRFNRENVSSYREMMYEHH